MLIDGSRRPCNHPEHTRHVAFGSLSENRLAAHKTKKAAHVHRTMSALEEISKLPGYNDDGTIVAPTEEQKADALKYATETGGFPPLALWSMPQFTPAMVKLFTD